MIEVKLIVDKDVVNNKLTFKVRYKDTFWIMCPLDADTGEEVCWIINDADIIKCKNQQEADILFNDAHKKASSFARLMGVQGAFPTEFQHDNINTGASRANERKTRDEKNRDHSNLYWTGKHRFGV